MQSIKAFFESRYLRITNSIAFWPTLLGIVFVSLAVLMRQFGGNALARAVDEFAPFLLIRDRDVSLSLLTTLIGGLISLMVFSFTMVMNLLSNATSNLTPRLLPSLIGSTRHQVVLGFYFGTILYCIIIAMGFGLSVDGEEPPSAAVAFAVIFGIVCLALFVAFIHGVSQSIQVGQALKNTHAFTIKTIDGVIERQRDHVAEPPDDYSTWTPISARRAGFFQSVDSEVLTAFAKTHGALVVITAIRGRFVLENDELGRINLTGLTAKQTEKLDEFIQYDETELTSQYYAHGIVRMLEVALKALSPGINDPGTALEAIDYLRHAFHAAEPLGTWESVNDKEATTRLWLALQPLSLIVDRVLDSLHTYGKEDPQVMRRLRSTVATLQLRCSTESVRRILERWADRLKSEAA